MARKNKFGIWGIVLAIAALTGITAIQAGLIGDLRRDPGLMRELQIRLLTDYMPEGGGALKNLLATGAGENAFNMAAASAGVSLDIRELKIGQPVFGGSGRYTRSGVLKVNFLLTENGKVLENRTNYYGYYYVPSRSEWKIRDRSSKILYYLSFLV